jgi:hypothetical protein
MTITDARGRYLGTMDDAIARPAGPWLTNRRVEIVIPRSALRGRDVREALADEIPVSPEVLAEMANGRRS